MPFTPFTNTSIYKQEYNRSYNYTLGYYLVLGYNTMIYYPHSSARLIQYYRSIRNLSTHIGFSYKTFPNKTLHAHSVTNIFPLNSPPLSLLTVYQVSMKYLKQNDYCIGLSRITLIMTTMYNIYSRL